MRHRRQLPRAGRRATRFAEQEPRAASRGTNRWGRGTRTEPPTQTPRPRLGARCDPFDLPENPPIPAPLSSGPALHWARPSPIPLPLIGCRSRPSWISRSPLAFQRKPLGAGHTPHLEPDHAFSSQGLLPNPAIHSASGVGCLRHEGESDGSLPTGSSRDGRRTGTQALTVTA